MQQISVAGDAWAAGLFEGEGTCGTLIARGETPCMQLSMTDEDVVRRFSTIVGRGRVFGPYEATGGRKPHWLWVLTGFVGVQFVIARFWRHLGARRRTQARAALLRALGRRPRPSKLRTHCIAGHPYSGKNVRGRRVCRVCMNAANQRSRAGRRA